VVSSDPEFNYYAFQQEGKLVERSYMDSFTKLFNKDTTRSMNAHKNINKYIRNLILDHFGPEALKDKILPDLEDVINRRLQDWAELPSLEVKKSTAAVSNIIQLICCSYFRRSIFNFQSLILSTITYLLVICR
jgi:hypothetical protein